MTTAEWITDAVGALEEAKWRLEVLQDADEATASDNEVLDRIYDVLASVPTGAAR